LCFNDFWLIPESANRPVGRYTVYLARQVGPEGKIFANDIDKNALTYLDSRSKRQGFNNIQTIIGEKDDP
jgi:16S rRNA C967 or C1407 C5-methylase (RsmB/RsmF family)